jgi:hypothetical protein
MLLLRCVVSLCCFAVLLRCAAKLNSRVTKLNSLLVLAAPATVVAFEL